MAPTRASFVPCPSCQRHVKSGDATCPFCDAELRAAAPAAIPDTRGWTRAAIFTFGAALAGCAATTTSTDGAPQDVATDTATDAPVDHGNIFPPYGHPAPDAGFADAAADDVPFDNGGIAPPYGIAPQDAGVADAGPPDDGSVKADYGAPPMCDASTDR